MATSASLTIAGTTTGDGISNQVLSENIAIATSTNQYLVQAVGTTYVTVTLPASPLAVPTLVILQVLSNASATALTLKGVTGDTGIALSLTNPTVLSIGSTQTTLGLVAAGGTVQLKIIYL